MKFISLVDPRNQNIITVDASSFVLRLEIDGAIREARLKVYMASILYELLREHPSPISYERITELLKEQGFAVYDVTRMHRKLSEIRQFMLQFHPSLEGFILNTRGVGYSLPLRLKNLHHIRENQEHIKFANPKIAQAMAILYDLINESIDMTATTKVIKCVHGYVMDRGPIKNVLVEKISIFDRCQKIIFKEIRLHEADFAGLRIAYLVAKLKTYVGLARISEYPISEVQWLDWFKQEVLMLFDELKRWMSFTERV